MAGIDDELQRIIFKFLALIYLFLFILSYFYKKLAYMLVFHVWM